MPKDKHEVVAVLQSQGKVVGMTGDGVNDAPALAKAQIGIAVAGATDAAQSAADIILTRPGLSPIFTAIVQSRKIFKRLKSYVIYRICVTVQVVAFLCMVSFVFNEAFEALYIILLALFHDLTIVTIAYDHQVAGAKPEQPTVRMLIFVAYTMGFVLSASSCILYVTGQHFLTAKFVTDFVYKESVMFLQISNSSAILIFNARTEGFSFLSKPAIQLFLSAVVSQVVVNFAMYFGIIVEALSVHDIAMTWVYDLSWLIIIDLVKMSIIKIQAEVESGVMNASRSGSMEFFGFTITKTPKKSAEPSRKNRSSRSRAEMSAKVARRSGSRSQTLAGPMAGIGK